MKKKITIMLAFNAEIEIDTDLSNEELEKTIQSYKHEETHRLLTKLNATPEDVEYNLEDGTWVGINEFIEVADWDEEEEDWIY